MYKKHLSEKIARVFEIVGYFQLIPAILLVILSALLVFPLLISIPVFGIGLTLFVGYIKHSRGNLSKGKISPLWFATFLFNFIPLLFSAIKYFNNESVTIGNAVFVYGLLIFWWVIACCLSFTAFYDEIIEGKSKLK